MLRRLLPLLVAGLVVTAILASLGFWQLRRMEWKAGELAAIQRGIERPPVALPAVIDPSMKYLPVVVSGRTTGDEILVLSGSHDLGGGYNVISGFQTEDGRRIMVDRGFITQDDRRTPRPPVALTVAGNLHWPDERAARRPSPTWPPASGSRARCRAWPRIWGPNPCWSWPVPFRAMRRG